MGTLKPPGGTRPFGPVPILQTQHPFFLYPQAITSNFPLTLKGAPDENQVRLFIYVRSKQVAGLTAFML